jgi:hypothetical protein
MMHGQRWRNGRPSVLPVAQWSSERTDGLKAHIESV